MLLAFSEIKHNKLKFSLIVLTLTLVVFLLLMLAAMGTGLIDGMTGAMVSLKPDLIVFQDSANFSLQRSNLMSSLKDDLASVDGVERIIPFGQIVVTAGYSGKTFDGSLILTEIDPMVNPEVIEGRALKTGDDNEVVADRSIIGKGPELGDELTVKPIGTRLKIVGLTTGRRLSMSPTIYVSKSRWQKIKLDILLKLATGQSGSGRVGKLESVNAFLIKAGPGTDIGRLKKRLESEVAGIGVATKNGAVDAFPGMAPMKLVIIALEGLSLVIGAVVVGIFFYILTLQKLSQIGMLKALGASTGYIFKDLVIQVSFLTLVAIIIGTILAYSAALTMPPTLALTFDIKGVLLSSISIFAMSFLGALFSLRHIVKIDAGIAIGQGD